MTTRINSLKGMDSIGRDKIGIFYDTQRKNRFISTEILSTYDLNDFSGKTRSVDCRKFGN